MRMAIALVALLVAGCASSPVRVVDGYPLGDPTDCSVNRECPEAVAMADAAYRPSLPVVRSVTYREGPSDTRRSGILFIRVYTLSDGTDHAVGVECGFDACRIDR